MHQVCNSEVICRFSTMIMGRKMLRKHCIWSFKLTNNADNHARPTKIYKLHDFKDLFTLFTVDKKIPIWNNFAWAIKSRFLQFLWVFTVFTISKNVTLPLSEPFYRTEKSYRIATWDCVKVTWVSQIYRDFLYKWKGHFFHFLY